MHPGVLNFEEIEREVNKMTEEEILEKEKELKAKEDELKGRETKVSEKETKLSEKETELSEKVEKLEEDKENLEQVREKLQEGKYPGPFLGLPKAQAVSLGDKCKGGDQKSCDILIKYATGGIYGYPKAQLEEMLKEVGIDVDLKEIELPSISNGEIDGLKNRIAALEASTKAKDKALEVATSDLAVMKRENQEMEVDTHINVLLAGGKLVPAQKELLRKILLADDSSGTIELEEDGKKKKLDKKEAIVHLLTTGPNKVDLTQKGVVIGPTDGDMKKAKKIINMTTEEWAKLSPEERKIKLQELDALQEKK